MGNRILFFEIFVLLGVKLSSCSETTLAGMECSSSSHCSGNGTSKPYLQCINGYCLCNPKMAHSVYEYLDLHTQSKVSCQDKSLSRICIGIYHADDSCACSPGKVAFRVAGHVGHCVSEDNSTSSGFGQYCSAVMTACDASQGLMCRNSKCFCPRDSHYFNITQQKCIRKLTYSLTYGQPCAEDSNGCEDRFTCLNGICQCRESCSTYLGTEGDQNKGWRLLVFKIAPALCVLLVVVIIACAIFRLSHSCHKRIREPTGDGTSVPLHRPSDLNMTRSPYGSPLNSTAQTYMSDSFLAPSAPEFEIPDDAPPPYEEAIKDSAVR
ncbi:uncharacterized protein LOC108681943 isoform X2 [Hyalella azteca]|uniref:Uncharacterized protein LOC108681943 isoform X2 n=1 Tax=Hyalella azteca TaxID=294128 RepID=A0A8B7PKJ4_HYAAZ|nr:uncharacterized protein LOC108681943 isoform X2 [Hyalella azteca]